MIDSKTWRERGREAALAGADLLDALTWIWTIYVSNIGATVLSVSMVDSNVVIFVVLGAGP